MHDAFNAAVTEIDDFLLLTDGVQRLSDGELAIYKERFSAGWVMPSFPLLPDYKIRLLVNGDLPYRAPRVAIYPPPKILAWPHVEEDGLLCIWQDTVTHDRKKIRDVTLILLQDAKELISKCITGENFKDFENEIVSYWNRYAHGSITMVSLCNPSGPSRNIVVAYLKSEKHVFAENEEILRNWLNNKYGIDTEKTLPISQTAIIWPNRVWHPGEYPRFVGDLFKLLESDKHSLSVLEERLLDIRRQTQSILFGFETDGGVAIVGTHVARPQKQKGNNDPLAHGFRNISSVPIEIFLARYSIGEVLGTKVDRQDPFWVHGRDHNQQDLLQLQNASVVILGIGSIGSTVATLLARAGVGKITLIDGGIFEPENSSRHELGSNQIKYNKALELAAKLGRDLPHIKVKGMPCFWQKAFSDNQNDILNANLVISCIGEWSSDSMLDDTRILSNQFPPVLYGWTEPYACIGHAILLQGTNHSLQSVCGPTGEAKLPIANWENGETVKQIPACGGQFQPYGAAELAHIHALISELALEVIKGEVVNSTYRVWLARTKILEQYGGKWNEEWVAEHGSPGLGGKLLDMPLSANN